MPAEQEVERGGDGQSVRSQPGACLEVPVCHLHPKSCRGFTEGLGREVIGLCVCRGTFSGEERMVPKGADVKQKALFRRLLNTRRDDGDLARQLHGGQLWRHRRPRAEKGLAPFSALWSPFETFNIF